MKFIRNIIVAGSCLSLTACASVKLPNVLDAITDAVQLTKEQYEKFCEKNPEHKACNGAERVAIERQLEEGPVVVRAQIAE